MSEKDTTVRIDSDAPVTDETDWEAFDALTDDEVTDDKRSALSSVSISISARAAADATTGHPSVTNPLFVNPEVGRVLMPHVHHNGAVGQSFTLRSTNTANIAFSATNWQPTTWTVVFTLLYW